MGTFPVNSMVFTSLPDMSEVVESLGPRFEDWEDFFMKEKGQGMMFSMGCLQMDIGSKVYTTWDKAYF